MRYYRITLVVRKAKVTRKMIVSLEKLDEIRYKKYNYRLNQD